jgi:hypothetical protein
MSASLLFMVQPMVGKMVLPLLGGSPAVWNACMVFFQALLLLGYLYAHHVSSKYVPRKQWYIHLLVLGLPLAAFILAVMFGSRHTPIAIAESLAPTGESSPIVSVLLLLTIAIGIPFFVVSTSAPLLQKWFTCTGHPSSRDPYFLYAASNLGSMISLLGYPLFVEPYLSIIGQAWLFAIGFAILAAMIAVCGNAAANPIATSPVNFAAARALTRGNDQGRQKDDANKRVVLPPPEPIEPPPTLARKAKWIALAFVPSSLMLGVTFHMTTDIASIPLLWVLPLALYLLSFIFAFGGRTTQHVMLFGLSALVEWFGWSADEQASKETDEPVRIVIGNLAPVMILLLVFVLISGVNPGVGIVLMLHILTFYAVAMMCHYELARDRPSPRYLTEFFLLMSVGGVLGGIFNALLAPIIFPHAYEYKIVLVLACLLVPQLAAPAASATPESTPDGQPKPPTDANTAQAEAGKKGRWNRERISLVLDFVFPVLMGLCFYYVYRLPGMNWFSSMGNGIAGTMNVAPITVKVILLFAVPVMVCFFFVDRPLRFALSVAAILGYSTYLETARGTLYSERSFFGILKIEQDKHLIGSIGRDADGNTIAAGEITYHRLVHGTTLHGTQIYSMRNNAYDMFQYLTALNPLDNLIVAGANQAFDPRQEPLTYYHRSGPVGAMFHELRCRKGGADAKAPFAMVGLGTGSASCYAQPGQSCTFYEIDPAVKHLVWDTDKYFTYVTDAINRKANMDIQMGDARLKLKENTDRKYALLLVDAFSSDSIPVHLLTKEAVELYLDRMTEDGMLGLHISNKYVRLEPVVAAIARELGLTARVWNDDSERRPGKTASSWVVLARKPEHLGDLYSPVGELIYGPDPGPGKDHRMRISMDDKLYETVLYQYPKELTQESPELYKQFNKSDDPTKAWLEWIDKKLPQVKDSTEQARLLLSRQLIAEYGAYTSVQRAMQIREGHGFRPLDYFHQVPAWTDDYSDVMRVMMLPELQAIRKFFGLPTPIER